MLAVPPNISPSIPMLKSVFILPFLSSFSFGKLNQSALVSATFALLLAFATFPNSSSKAFLNFVVIFFPFAKLFLYFNFTQKIFYHYNVYIIMIFYIFILKRHDINISKSF